MVISMLKIRRPLGRLIFNMGIAIPGKTVFFIETAPCFFITVYDSVMLRAKQFDAPKEWDDLSVKNFR